MQIVIDIPESIIEHIKDGSFGARPNDKYLLAYAAMEGIRLPKGHGRLIDADEMATTITARFFNSIHYGEMLKALWDSTTIIEAESEDEE